MEAKRTLPHYAVACEDQRDAINFVGHFVQDAVDGERGGGHSDSEFYFKSLWRLRELLGGFRYHPQLQTGVTGGRIGCK